jgi:hypothetical protein
LTDTDKVTVTIKGSGEAPWIVWHADTIEEAESLIEEAIKGPLYQDAAEASALLAGAVRAANGLGQQAQQDDKAQAQQGYQSQRQAVQQNTQQGYNQPAQQGFAGTPHPEGKTCGQCGAGVVGKQPKVKRMWTCPNQRTQGDGHFMEWIRD